MSIDVCPHCGEQDDGSTDHECDGDQSPETARVRQAYADDLDRRFPRKHRAPRFIPSPEPEDPT